MQARCKALSVTLHQVRTLPCLIGLELTLNPETLKYIPRSGFSSDAALGMRARGGADTPLLTDPVSWQHQTAVGLDAGADALRHDIRYPILNSKLQAPSTKEHWDWRPSLFFCIALEPKVEWFERL